MSCPICNKKADPKYHPFCSRRCADVDLGRWLSGGYRIPADRLEEPGEGASDADAPERPPRPH